MAAFQAISAAIAQDDMQKLHAAEEEARAVYSRWKLPQSPLPIAPAEGKPARINEDVTLIDALSQRACGRMDSTFRESHTLGVMRQKIGERAGPSNAINNLRGDSQSNVDTELEQLERLFQDAGIKNWSLHARTLVDLGITCGDLQRGIMHEAKGGQNRDEIAVCNRLDDVARIASLPVGVKLKLRVALLRALPVPLSD